MANALTPVFRSERNFPVPSRVDGRIADVEALARWLDYAFALPGGFRFGFAGIIGLIPGIGDLIDALISAYIVYRAVQLGVSRGALARMVVNVGIEAAVGAVPFIGTLFDVAFKANLRNYRLLQSHIENPRRQTMLDWAFVCGTLLLALAAIALPVWVLVTLTRTLMHSM